MRMPTYAVTKALIVVALAGCWSSLASASTGEAPRDGFRIRSDLFVGMDAWSLNPSVDEDSSFETGLWDNTWLMLPNAATEHTYRPVSPFLRYQAAVKLSRDWSSELKFRADQNFGAVFDELALTWQPSPQLGARVGVLDFKTTWCRTYDVDSHWMREPDSFCTFNQIKDGVAGAPGMQLISQNRSNDQLLTVVAGVYDTMLLDYETDEFSNFFTSRQMQVLENQKHGLSVSWLNTYSGNEIRASWLRSDQVARDPNLVAPVEQSADLFYLGATQHWGTRHQMRYVYTRFLSDRAFRIAGTDRAPQVDVNSLSDQRDSHALEWLYQWDALNRWSMGASLFEMRAKETVVIEGETFRSDPFFKLKHHGFYVGWRRELNRNMFVTAQAMWVSQRHAYYDAPNLTSHGQAYGLRWAYRY